MPEMTGKVAFVTGGTRGIGRATLLQLVADHERLGISRVGFQYNSSVDLAQALIEEIEHTLGQGSACAFQGNFYQDEDPIRVAKEVLAAFGRVDILINNAGDPGRNNPFRGLKVADFETAMQLNFTSKKDMTYGLIKAMMDAEWGRIINMSSMAGVRGNPGQTAYSAAEAAVIGFSLALSREVGSRGITVNVIAPGHIDTDATRKNLPPKRAEEMHSVQSIKRAGQPEEVAALISYLAMEEAGFTTGQVFEIDGGLP